MDLANAILAALASIVTVILLLAGIGCLIRSVFKLRTDSVQKSLLSIWIGYGSTLFTLQIWHLFSAVNLIAFLIFGLTGLCGLLLNRKDLWRWLRSVRSIGVTGYVITGLLALYALVLSDVAIGPIRNVDTGIYHYSAVRWMTTFPVVPGLANLNTRLGFNNSSLLFPALLDSGFWPRSAQHISSGVIFLTLAAQFAAAAFGVLTNTPAKLSDVFAVFVLGFGLHHSYYDATAFSTDMPVFALASVLYIQVIRIVRDELDDPRELAFTTGAAIFLAAVAISSKISLCVFTGSAVVIVLWTQWPRLRADAFGKRIVMGSLAASVVCMVIWSIRGAIVTGYPLYPITTGALAVDWRVPKETAVVVQHWITCWARRPWAHWKETLGRSDWIADWFRVEILPQVWDFQIPILLCILTAIPIVTQLRLAKKGSLRSPLWLLLIPNLLSLIYWFFSAPGLRLGAGNFWLLAATCATLATFVLNEGLDPIYSKLFTRGGILLGFVAAAVVQWIILVPGSAGGWYPAPQITYFKFPSDSGLIVLIPENVNEPSSWDSPLPTTPYPHRRLALRRPGDLSSGFKVEPFDDSTVIGITP